MWIKWFIIHFIGLADRQTNKQENKQPNKRSRGYRWKPRQWSQWGHRRRDPRDLTMTITIQQMLEIKSRAWSQTYLSPAENTSEQVIKNWFRSTDAPKGQLHGTANILPLRLLLKLRYINCKQDWRVPGSGPQVCAAIHDERAFSLWAAFFFKVNGFETVAWRAPGGTLASACRVL